MPFITHQKLRPLLIALLVTTMTGCSFIQPVKPWEKGTLARSDMLFKGNPLDTQYSEHVYTSREAAAGGAAVGGGGCGCN
jgi:hypothetical protein